MTNIEGTNTKRTITAVQDAAIKEYRTALETNDFNRLLFAIVGLSDVGLDEAQALELIARQYNVTDAS